MAFTSTRLFDVSPDRIRGMALALESKLRQEGYETKVDMLLGGDSLVSITKGGLFKAVVGMKTALKVEIRSTGRGVQAKTSVGIWGHQIVPTVIMLLWFWPIIITQIWGLVQQNRLDSHVMDILAEAAGNGHYAIPAQDDEETAARFCPQCGHAVTGKFCSNCGAKV